MYKNPIIVFEGIECTGKSHHIKKVVSYLKKKKKNFIQIREPGGSKNAEIIRKLILSNKSTFNKYTDLLLYLSARSENTELIKKNAGKKIILIVSSEGLWIVILCFGPCVAFKVNCINFVIK